MKKKIISEVQGRERLSKQDNYPEKKKAKMAKPMMVSLTPLSCLYSYKSRIQNYPYDDIKSPLIINHERVIGPLFP